MLLTDARIKMFKSIEDSDPVLIDPYVTVLVGQNEAGKTAFLQAMHKAKPVDTDIAYDVTDDYPRRSLTEYERQHEKSPAVVAQLTYEFQQRDLDRVKEKYGVELPADFKFTISHKYDGKSTVLFDVPEKPYIQQIVREASLPAGIAKKGNNILDESSPSC
jgi:predicted ATP-dependent endonuclease of OLD family